MGYAPLVSVIVPVYKTEKFIHRCIDSVLNQTYSNWEMILVDDGSPDACGQICDSYAEKDGRIHVIHQENQGLSAARNAGIKICKGEWIYFLDSDDLWLPEKLEKQINFMISHEYVFSYHEYEKIDEYGKPLNVYVTGPKIVTKQKMYNYCYPGCLTFMYNVKTMGQIQIKDIKKNNDYAILLQLCKKANCYLLKENLAEYRIRKKSISHDKLMKKLKSHYDLFHGCDGKPAVIAFWYACWNMWYGVIKKVKYERKF